MAFATFQEIRGAVLLRAPGLPVPMAEQFINSAYRRCIDTFRWSGQRVEAELVLAAPYSTGTISVTQSSTAVTGTGTVWTAAMTNRQIVIGGEGPIYTFTRTADTTGTLDRIYGGATNALATYSIQPIYLSPESDFLSWVSVRDISREESLNFDFPAEWLDAVDPARTSEGDPTHLVAATFTAAPPRWEIWPRPDATLTLSTRYLKRPNDLSANADVPIFPIRGSGLLEGALAEISLWPGTAERPNPYFRPDLHEAHEKRFLAALQLFQREDQEIAQTDITNAEGAPSLSSTWAQEHAVRA